VLHEHLKQVHDLFRESLGLRNNGDNLVSGFFSLGIAISHSVVNQLLDFLDVLISFIRMLKSCIT
jgi:hypothetical protein